jgi:hypothetical protein
MFALATASLLASAATAGKPGGGNAGSTTLAACGPNDITAPSVTMITCTGYISGNLLNQSHSAQDLQILGNFPYASGWDGQAKDVLASATKLDKSGELNFGVTLTGVTILGIHFGGGTGGPGGESTAFYVLDAAQGVNQLHLKYDSTFSNAYLFATGLTRHVAAAPEPGTWVTMIMGFGMTGFQMRRRKRAAARA